MRGDWSESWSAPRRRLSAPSRRRHPSFLSCPLVEQVQCREEGGRKRRRGERRERRREAERGNDLQFRMGRQAVRIMDFHSLPSFSSSSPLHPPLPPSLLLLLPPLPPSFPSPSLQVNDRGRQVLKRHLLSPESYPILSIHPSIPSLPSHSVK